MKSLFVILFILSAFDICISSPIGRPSFFRRRRQATPENFLSSDFLCAVKCGIDHSSAWSKINSIDSASANNVSIFMPTNIVRTTGTMLNDTFNDLCIVYESYSNCLRLCPNDVMTNSLRQGVTHLGVLCDPSKTGYIAQTPCLYSNRQLLQDNCQGATEDLVTASKALQDLHRSDGVGFATNALPAVRQLCDAANKQAFCILPAVKQQCGDQASDLLQSILKAALGSLRQVAGDDLDQLMPAECATLFHTMENGAKFNFTTPHEQSILDNSTTRAVVNATSIDTANRNFSNRSDLAFDGLSVHRANTANSVLAFRNGPLADDPISNSAVSSKDFYGYTVYAAGVMTYYSLKALEVLIGTKRLL